MGSLDNGPELPASRGGSPSQAASPEGLAGMGGTDGFGGFGQSFLTDSVGRGGANKPGDVHTASSFLAANGLMEAPTREPTEDFHRAIEAGQAKLADLSNGGHHVTGRVDPWDHTEILSQRAVSAGHMRPPNSSAATPTPASLTAQQTLPAPAPPAQQLASASATPGASAMAVAEDQHDAWVKQLIEAGFTRASAEDVARTGAGNVAYMLEMARDSVGPNLLERGLGTISRLSQSLRKPFNGAKGVGGIKGRVPTGYDLPSPMCIERALAPL